MFSSTEYGGSGSGGVVGEEWLGWSSKAGLGSGSVGLGSGRAGMGS